MPQVFIFHIDLTLSVAMVTENGRQYRLKCRNVILVHILELLQTVLSKIRYQHSEIPKRCFVYLVIIYHPFKYRFGICLCSMLAVLLNLQISAQNYIFFLFKPILAAIFCNHSHH